MFQQTVIAWALHVQMFTAADQLSVPISAPVATHSQASSDTGRDLAPRLACDSNGNWIAVWQSTENLNGTIGSEEDIFFSRSDDFGVSWSGAFLLNSTGSGDGTMNFDELPSICTDNQGTWLVVWESTYSFAGTVPGPDRDIHFSRSVDNGQTWTVPARVNNNGGTDFGHDREPQVMTDGKGVWIVVWRSLETFNSTIGPDADILMARSTDAGATWSFPVPLNTNAANDTGQDIYPRLATDGEGNWVVAWASNDSLQGTIGTDYDVLCARSADNGATWSAPAPVNTGATMDGSAIDTEPHIAVDENGRWTVAWASNNSLGGSIGVDYDILISRSEDVGATWSAPAPLNSNAASDSGNDNWPWLAVDRNGNMAAAWHSTDTLGGSVGADLDVFISHSDDLGLGWTAPSALNTDAGVDSGADQLAHITADTRGAWLTVWQSHDAPGSPLGTDGDVLAARFALPDCNLNTMPDFAETDCNENLVPDDCDIASGTSADLNGNGIPDECERPGRPCIADCSPPPDGVVDIDDLLFIISNWGALGGPADIAPPGGDGIVNIDDLLAVIGSWGPCPGAGDAGG